MKTSDHRHLRAAAVLGVLAVVASASVASSETSGSPTPVGPRYGCALGQVLQLTGDVLTCRRTTTTTTPQTREDDLALMCPSGQHAASEAGPDKCLPIVGQPVKPACPAAACPTGAKCTLPKYVVDHVNGTIDKCVRSVTTSVPTTVVDYFAPTPK